MNSSTTANILRKIRVACFQVDLSVRPLVPAQKFAFEFMPFDASPAVVQFDSKGLGSHLPRSA
jgi:hypothetical protein